MDEKRREISNKIEELLKKSREKGLTDQDIQKQAGSLLKLQRKWSWRAWKRYCSILLILFFIIYALSHIEFIKRSYYWAAKTIFIYTVQYNGWSSFYMDECLIPNPFHEIRTLTNEDCELCENIKLIPRLSNISSALVAENFLKQDRPLIVTDAVDNTWPAVSLYNINFLRQIFEKEEELKSAPPCMYASNVRMKRGNLPKLLELASNNHITNWYAHWENCDKQAAKKLRTFYQRPYFMPSMVEGGETNWLLISSRYTTAKFKPADINLPMVWIAQLKGENKFRLTPREPCNSTCSPIYTTLKPKELRLLSFSNTLKLYS
ncbi:DgyrCDS9463 [Dimorphilus gyrociliatus]|uniref:DgyrCDS9463 n=1 Tax=Dimorphilus gyrociliatus TaxID=2664684 RepID=A0A7I8VX17_9ANNE|nr:DgyrCDS9463 [Dimorphilus gyrociliatus]